MALKEYQAKRDFTRTREPAGKPLSVRRARRALFVVQKHDASHLHYDFRLEMEGVLKSWAVPKGFPTRRGDRRLAIQVEDHPFDYKDFEGTIPEGNYGAGTVMVWDTGTYEVLGVDPLHALSEGKLHVVLHGKKLKGEWTLVRMRPRSENAKPQWLLLKSGSDLEELSKQQEDRSVRTGRSMEEIAGARRQRVWQSTGSAGALAGESPKPRSARRNVTRGGPAGSPAGMPALPLRSRIPKPPASSAVSATKALRSLPLAKPRFIEPMKALLVDSLPRGDDWIYELKFDGVRALAAKDGSQVRLYSRNAKDLTVKYERVTAALEQLAARQAVLDGEIVALDPQGRSSFQLLQTYHMTAKKPPLFYYVFDLLNLEGQDLSSLPLGQRKDLAEKILAGVPSAIRFSPGIRANSDKVLRELKARGLEGLLAKRNDSIYEPGRRSRNWVKFKWSNEQEFVIGGYTQPKGGRACFGAILVGYYEQEKLQFVAKVGTGFDEKRLSSLYKQFQKLKRPTCPFANLPEKSATSRGLTASQMRFCTWLEPKLVGEIRFAEWTRDGHLRQPVFLGLREDKDPNEVVREKPA